MESVYVKEVNSEVLVCLDYNHSTKLAALQEAAKALQREVLREQRRIERDNYRENHNDGIPEPRRTDGQ